MVVNEGYPAVFHHEGHKGHKGIEVKEIPKVTPKQAESHTVSVEILTSNV